MAIEINPHNIALSRADIDLFEAELGFTLPDDYKAFLLRYNAGGIEERQWQSPGFYAKPVPPLAEDERWIAPDDFWDIALFHGLNLPETEYGDLRDIGPVMVGWGHAAELLPIASRYDGAKYVLDCGASRRGAVLLAGADRGSERSNEEPVAMGDYHMLCRSFTELLEGLRYVPTPP